MLPGVACAQWAMWPSGLSPDLDTISPDYFGGRFTFYVRVNKTSRYAFSFNAIDDVARLYVVGGRLGCAAAGRRAHRVTRPAC